MGYLVELYVRGEGEVGFCGWLGQWRFMYISVLSRAQFEVSRHSRYYHIFIATKWKYLLKCVQTCTSSRAIGSRLGPCVADVMDSNVDSSTLN